MTERAEAPRDRTPGRQICIRFDVDTVRCVRQGMPALLDLAARLGVRFTFFVNMGRSVARGDVLERLVAGSGRPDSAAKLSPLRKLGPAAAAVTALLNPRIGADHPEVLRRAVEEGHELGLHGGLNHGLWQARAAEWDQGKVREEVESGLALLRSAVGRTPAGFASPGWVTPDPLPGVIEELGFAYLADEHGTEGVERLAHASGVASVATNFTGEPGGVAYLEHLRARGLGDGAVEADFAERLEGVESLAVVYDHPCHAGVHELPTIARMVEIALDRGFEVATLREAVRKRSSVVR